MNDIYTNKTYLTLNPTWHEEDSPWKAKQVLQMVQLHSLTPTSIVEVGCGIGGILTCLCDALPMTCVLHGFDIAPEAIAKAKRQETDRLHFYNQDLFSTADNYDLLLAMDVIEHVPDYLGFLAQCRNKARFKIYHIPLDLHVSSILRGSLMNARKSVGHIHYFNAESALASLIDTGHNVVDYFYTDGGIGLADLHPSVKRSIANIPRRAISTFSTRWAARLLGGYSLLVLTE